MKRKFLLWGISISLVFNFFSVKSIAQDPSIRDTILFDLIWDYSTKGYHYLEIDINLDSAEYYLLKAIDLQYKTSSYKIDRRVAINHISLASVYRKIFNTNLTLMHLNEAESILMKDDPNDQLFASLYHNKGNLYKRKNDFYRTKEYYEYALDFLIRTGYQNTTDFSFVYSSYINLLFELGEFELAEEQMSLININTLKASPLLEFRIHITNATAYSKLGKYESAKFHFEKARIIIQNQIENNEYNNQIIRYYYNVIDFHLHYKEYNKALVECDRALSFIEALDPNSTKNKVIDHSNILYRSAMIHSLQGNLDRSLNLTSRGIDNLNAFLNSLATSYGGSSTKNKLSTVLPLLFVLKSQIYFKKYSISNSFDDLQSSYLAYTEAIQTLNSMKLSMQNEDSKLYATSQILDIYYEAIYVGKLLYEKTGEFEYLEKSFEFAESSKSFALYSEIKDVEAMEFSDLPTEVREKEERIIGEKQAYEKLLYEEQLTSNPDIKKIEIYKDQLFHLKDDYDDLKQTIEQNNSKYYELKYNPKFVTLEEVQQELPYKEALIEYVLTDTMLITYLVDRKGINVFSQDIGPEFANECLEYYQLLYKQNFSSGVHENYRRFVTLGRKFFNILIEPCLQYTDRKSFTIVPDGAITYIPFEGILTRDTDTEYINYMVLPYLIKDYSVGYSHSSTLMFSERLKTKSPEKKVLAFAPKYTNPLKNAPLELVRQALPDDEYLMPLGGIIKEVQSINETVPSRVFLNEKATEANFKKYASDYNVLHLAMHTIMRDDDPLYSHLAFTNVETNDTIEDNKLYAYEIYNLKLNAQMAVLSSCSSGFGKMQKGEGMMSLARGFIYAGCPSIIMTLWRVSDQSSSELMTSFYKYLKKGKSKQEAMRLAKIKFLDTADELTSNPYFWSGFVVVGDGSPIYRKSGLAYWMIIISVFIGVLLFFQYKRS